MAAGGYPLLPGYDAPPSPAWYQPGMQTSAHLDNESEGWDLLRRLWRRKGLIAGITMGAAAVGITCVVLMTPRYTAEARVLIGVQEPKVLNIQSVLDAIAPNDDTVRSEAYIIASRSTASEVAYRLALDTSPVFNPNLAPEPTWLEKLHPGYLLSLVKAKLAEVKDVFITPPDDAGPETGPPDQEAENAYVRQTIENRLLYGLEVEPLNRSHVLRIGAEFEDPVLAADIANAFARVYVERRLVAKKKANNQANTWLQSQIAGLQGKVAEAERAVETYRRSNGLLSTRSETLVAQQLAALNQELMAAEKTRTEARANLEQAQNLAKQGGKADDLPAVLQSPMILLLRGKQADMEREAADLAAKYTEKHPKRRAIRAQINDVNAKVRAEIKRIVGGLRNALRIATDRYNQVSTQLDDLKSRMGSANDKQVRLRQLERQAEAERNMLEQLLQRSTETTHQADLVQPGAEIISAAAVPNFPSFPPGKVIVVVAILAGLGCGVLIALLVERLDQTFRTSETIEEYTGLNTLAVLPRIKDRRSGPLDHVLTKPDSAYTNAIRMLGAQLTVGHRAGGPPGIVMFTSAVPGEGKSHTSCSFAQLMASEGRDVVLVDLDWRQPTQHLNFGSANRIGVLDVLHGKSSIEDALYRDERSNVAVMFAGRSAGAGGVTVSLDRLRLLLQHLSTRHDLVVLDTPPLIVTPEMLFLSQLADTVVFTVRWGSTTRRAVTSELKHLMRAGANISGVALSQVDLRQYNKYSYDDGGYLRHHFLVHDAR